MGVKGLWPLIESAGHPVSLESLENQVLAIDVSIWLNQFVKGFREKKGWKNESTHISKSHLVGLFHRVSKLLFYKIKPVFVFDGGVPVYKLKTIQQRGKRKLKALDTSEQCRKKLMKNYLNNQIKRNKQQNGASENVNDNSVEAEFRTPSTSKESGNLYELPDINTELDDFSPEFVQKSHLKKYQNLNNIDLNSNDFKSLPANVRYEILTALREKRKRLNQVDEIPREINSFSTYQMTRLLHRSDIQQKIEDTEKEMNEEVQLGDMDDRFEFESRRVMSDSASNVIFINRNNLASQQGRSKFLNGSQDLNPEPIFKYQGNIYGEVEGYNYGKTEAIEMDKSSSIAKVVFKKSDIADMEKIDTEIKVIMDRMQRFEDNISETSESESEDEIREENIWEVNTCNSNNVTKDVEIIQTRGPQSTQESQSSTSVDEKLEESKNDASIVDIDDDSRPELITVNDIIIDEVENLSNKSFTGKTDDPEACSTNKGDYTQIKKFPSERTVSEEQSSINEKTETIRSTNEKTEASRQSERENVQLKNPEQSKKVVINLESEKDLVKEFQKQERRGATVTETMIAESKEFLKLFGVPYVESPMEAEAQCAALEILGLTDGTITDDSDVWLFGGKTTYKNFFTQSKYVELYKSTEIEDHFKFSREQMICLALLVGSDYTNGIESVGSVTALEILSEFKGNGLNPLIHFKEWLDSKRKSGDKSPENKIRAKFLKLNIPDDFPNKFIYDAYINPQVEKSSEKFSWNLPNLDLIRDYCFQNFGWSQEKVDETILPIMKKLNEKQTQMRIDYYFKSGIRSQTSEFTTSKRLNQAINKLKGGTATGKPNVKNTSKPRGKLSERVKNQTTAKRSYKRQTTTKKSKTTSNSRTSNQPQLSESSSDDNGA